MKKIILLSLTAFCLFACNKFDKPPLPDVVTVPELVELSPITVSIVTGQTTQFTAKYYNNLGKEAPLPIGAIWASNDTTLATISNQGVATGKLVGQTSIKISINGLTALANINIVANNSVVANVNITPSNVQEVVLNGTINMTANGTNLTGNVLPGLSFLWNTSEPNIVSINNNGLATALGYGTANITATSSNIQSPPTLVQVIRQGNFSGNNSMGIAKLKIENGLLKLTTTATFAFSQAPDLRIYLSTNRTSITATNSVQIAPLTAAGITGGARSWNVPANVTITQYRYAVIWCAQFTSSYGAADLGN